MSKNIDTQFRKGEAVSSSGRLMKRMLQRVFAQLEARMKVTNQQFGVWKQTLADGTEMWLTINFNGPVPIRRSFVVAKPSANILVLPSEFVGHCISTLTKQSFLVGNTIENIEIPTNSAGNCSFTFNEDFRISWWNNTTTTTEGIFNSNANRDHHGMIFSPDFLDYSEYANSKAIYCNRYFLGNIPWGFVTGAGIYTNELYVTASDKATPGIVKLYKAVVSVDEGGIPSISGFTLLDETTDLYLIQQWQFHPTDKIAVALGDTVLNGDNEFDNITEQYCEFDNDVVTFNKVTADKTEPLNFTTAEIIKNLNWVFLSSNVVEGETFNFYALTFQTGFNYVFPAQKRPFVTGYDKNGDLITYWLEVDYKNYFVMESNTSSTQQTLEYKLIVKLYKNTNKELIFDLITDLTNIDLNTGFTYNDTICKGYSFPEGITPTYTSYLGMVDLVGNILPGQSVPTLYQGYPGETLEFIFGPVEFDLTPPSWEVYSAPWPLVTTPFSYSIPAIDWHPGVHEIASGISIINEAPIWHKSGKICSAFPSFNKLIIREETNSVCRNFQNKYTHFSEQWKFWNRYADSLSWVDFPFFAEILKHPLTDAYASYSMYNGSFLVFEWTTTWVIPYLYWNQYSPDTQNKNDVKIQHRVYTDNGAPLYSHTFGNSTLDIINLEEGPLLDNYWTTFASVYIPPYSSVVETITGVPDTNYPRPGFGYSAADPYRDFLQQHYRQVVGVWPEETASVISLRKFFSQFFNTPTQFKTSLVMDKGVEDTNYFFVVYNNLDKWLNTDEYICRADGKILNLNTVLKDFTGVGNMCPGSSNGFSGIALK